MSKVHDIHTIAEKYLRDLENGKASFYAPADNADVLPLGAVISDRVVVMREEAPHYLAGLKPSGRPVFTHDLKLAASYDSASLKLVDILMRMKVYQTEVQTMPACWFSNHQHG
jgi:hypothetical protein